MRPMRTVAPVLVVLFLVQLVGLFAGIPRFVHPPGKSLVPGLLFALFGATVYAGLLWASYRRIRAGTTEAAVATRRGILCVVLGVGWAATSAAVVWNESTSMLLGMLAIGGLFVWYPLVLAGALFLLAVRR